MNVQVLPCHFLHVESYWPLGLLLLYHRDPLSCSLSLEVILTSIHPYIKAILFELLRGRYSLTR